MQLAHSTADYSILHSPCTGTCKDALQLFHLLLAIPGHCTTASRRPVSVCALTTSLTSVASYSLLNEKTGLGATISFRLRSLLHIRPYVSGAAAWKIARIAVEYRPLVSLPASQNIRIYTQNWTPSLQRKVQ